MYTYLGYYIVIERIKEEYTTKVKVCPNDHKIESVFVFCPCCGEKLIEIDEQRTRMIDYESERDELEMIDDFVSVYSSYSTDKHTHEIIIPNKPKGGKLSYEWVQTEITNELKEKYREEFYDTYSNQTELLRERFVINIKFGLITYSL